jgi:hypothetical protein
MVEMKHLDAYRLFPRPLEAGSDLKTELLTLSLADLDPEPYYQVRPLDRLPLPFPSSTPAWVAGIENRQPFLRSFPWYPRSS